MVPMILPSFTGVNKTDSSAAQAYVHLPRSKSLIELIGIYFSINVYGVALYELLAILVRKILEI